MDLLKAYESRARFDGYTEDDRPSAFTDTVRAAFRLTRREELSNSSALAWNGAWDEIAKTTGDLGENVNLVNWWGKSVPKVVRDSLHESASRNDLDTNPYWRSAPPQTREAFEYYQGLQRRFPEKYPSETEMAETMKRSLAEKRGDDQHTMQRGGGVANFLGTAGAIMTDPLVTFSLPLGAELGAGRTALQTIGRVAAIEGGIGLGVEVPIQAEVFKWKREIESPWSFKDAAYNVLSAGAGGSLLGGTIAGGVVGTRKALAAWRASGTPRTPETDAAEQILEETIALHQENPFAAPGLDEQIDFTPGRFHDQQHERAFETARAQHADHRPVDVANEFLLEPEDSINNVLVRAENPDDLVDIDPAALDIDAETFQFKSGADGVGVTDALKDVTQFDRRLAGVSLIWERADGKQFIADGHQRLALANRALAAGQDPVEVRLNGFILREADGITAADARQMAAVKNMAEGSGSALDAAKILRDVGPAGEALLPPLPPRSALVRQARGLSNLSEDSFMQVVNDAIDVRFGALVGGATLDPKLQQAMIDVLRRTKPANEVQARSIVDQVRTAGTTNRVTEDLFGETQVTESLYLERAQVLDAALREARKDKAVFGRLLSDEGRITETGQNRLDRAANQERLQEASNATNQVSRLANSKGPISEALTEAARQVKAGEKPASVAASFLETARREVLAGNNSGDAPGSTGSVSKKKGTPRQLDEGTEDIFDVNVEIPAKPDAAPRSIVRTVDNSRTPGPEATRTGTIPDSEYDAVMAQAGELIEDHGEFARVAREVNGELEMRSLGGELERLDALEDTLERVRICSMSERATG